MFQMDKYTSEKHNVFKKLISKGYLFVCVYKIPLCKMQNYKVILNVFIYMYISKIYKHKMISAKWQIRKLQALQHLQTLLHNAMEMKKDHKGLVLAITWQQIGQHTRNKFSHTYNLSTLNQEEIESMNRPITIKKNEPVIKKPLNKERLRTRCLHL